MSSFSPMNIWDSYPPSYRQAEIAAVLQAVRAGECAALVGLSGAGKSNLLGFLANRLRQPDLPEFLLLDCNRLPSAGVAGLLALLAESLAPQASSPLISLKALEKQIADRLAAHPSGLCLLLDRFDAFPHSELPLVSSSLRALRDTFKYSLTYIIAARRPLPDDSELAELFFAYTLWLGTLSASDARWSIEQYSARKGLSWSEQTLHAIYTLSGGYPSFLRAICEAHSLGCPLELPALRLHPAVQRRIEEFWRDQPSPADLERSGLQDHRLLVPPPHQAHPPPLDPSSLTAAEHRLWLFFQQHPGEVCSKDDLIRAVWSEEAFLDGLRDDSLAQLVRRLRLKIEPDPAKPRRIQTLPGRGYRFSE